MTASFYKIMSAIGLTVALGTVPAHAFPDKPIEIVVPFPAGAISDLAARLVAEKMREQLGQPVLVENRPGAAGMIGAADVAQSAPDGYRIMLGSNSTNAINSSIYETMPYRIAEDFSPISMAGEIPSVLIARADFPADDVAGVIDVASQDPGSVSFAFGNTTGQVAGEMLNHTVPGIEIYGIPYGGEPLGITDLVGGHVDLMFLNLPVALPMIEQGRAKPIALPGGATVESLPGVPRIAETVADYTIPNGWLAFFAPADTPSDVVEVLNAAIVQALEDAEVRARLEESGGYIVQSSTPEELAERVEVDIRRWAELVEIAGIPKQ